MNYSKENNSIVVFDLAQFDFTHIVECGQTFRYRNEADCHTIFSKNKFCVLQKKKDCVIINTSDVDYFINYFDLNRDYEKIKESLCKYDGMENAIFYGNGIRILNQDPYEMIISFILSSNNNIPRIKTIIERICEHLGDKTEWGYAFPTTEQMVRADEQFFRFVGAGYRANYLKETAERLSDFDLEHLKECSTEKARKELMTLKGVGRKVADCILLFAYHKTDVFPMDTWTKRIYTMLGFCEERVPEKQAQRLIEKFGALSGYAQQYLYYYYRTNK